MYILLQADYYLPRVDFVACLMNSASPLINLYGNEGVGKSAMVFA